MGELSPEAQKIIQRYALSAGKAFKHISTCTLTGAACVCCSAASALGPTQRACMSDPRGGHCSDRRHAAWTVV